jgi:molybdopterin synthase catalytic subunit
MIRLQQEPFDLGSEYAALKRGHAGIGGIAVFVGTVRAQSGDAPIRSMTLEHYPQMTERALAAIEAEARARWPLIARPRPRFGSSRRPLGGRLGWPPGPKMT